MFPRLKLIHLQSRFRRALAFLKPLDILSKLIGCLEVIFDSKPLK